jgi:hypothetical protein
LSERKKNKGKMNSSSNFSTVRPQNSETGERPLPLDIILTAFGDTLILNYVWFFPFVVFGSIGLLGNILCFVIFLNKEFATMPMYSYLRVYSVNSGLICLLSIFLFVASTKRLFPALNTYGSQVYFLWVYLPGVNGMQAMAQLLDIVVTIDRIGFFNNRVKAMMTRASPRIICFVFLILSCLNGLIYYARSVPFGVPVGSVLDTNTGQVITDFVIWVPGTAEISKSDAAILFFTVYFFVRESILMIGEIVPNCVSLYYLKGYYGKKMAQVVKENRLSNTTGKKNGNSTSLTAKTTITVATADQVIERVAAQQMTELSRADRSASLMAFVLCLLSILSHSVTIAASLYGLLQPVDLVASNLVSQIYAYAASKLFLNVNLILIVKMIFLNSIRIICKDDLLLAVKHALNLVIFYSFNKSFKKVCRRCIGFGVGNEQN